MVAGRIKQRKTMYNDEQTYGVRKTHVLTVAFLYLIIFGYYVRAETTLIGIDWFTLIVSCIIMLLLLTFAFVMSLCCIDGIVKYLRIKKNLIVDIIISFGYVPIGIIVVDLCFSGGLMSLFDPRM